VFLRASYLLCVTTTDVGGAAASGLVTVNILANLENQPIISSVSGARGPDPPTSGGTLISFAGSNLGPGTVTASYSNARGASYIAAGCTVVSSELITCLTVPGWDGGFTWSVAVNGVVALTTGDMSMSYAAPTVASLSASAQGASTAGGAVVTILGSNFGANPTQNPRALGYAYAYAPLAVFFGGNGYEFACGVTALNHTELQCTMPPGLGAGLPWLVSVGTALSTTPPSSAPAALLFSYAAPVVTGVVGVGGVVVTALDTWGGQQVQIIGSNFGPATVTSRLDASVRTPLAGDPQYLGTSVRFGGAAGTLLSFAGCVQAPVTAHTTITCTTAAGVGVGHRVALSIGGQAAAAWPASGPGLAFLPPTLTAISGQGSINADTSGGQVVVLSGRHFGPVVFPLASIDSVTYGHPLTAPAQYSGQGCRVTTQTPLVSQITCSTAPGVGRNLRWAVSVGGQLATGATLLSSYSAPQVFAFSGAGAVDALTVGAQSVVVSVSVRGQEAVAARRHVSPAVAARRHVSPAVAARRRVSPAAEAPPPPTHPLAHFLSPAPSS
jgi:hypothetical protein